MSDQNQNAPVVAIVGATGAVGVEMIHCLEQRNFPLSRLKLLASPRSAGRKMKFKNEEIVVQPLSDQSFKDVDIALFSASGAVSREFAPIAVKDGCVVVDNSSAFRMDPNVPLVVPEINAGEIERHKGIIANPNCAAIISITPLWPVHQKNPIKRLIVSTYQSASGAGAAAMTELEESTKAYIEGREYKNTVLPHPYAFNLFNHNTKIDPDTGYNDEEMKVIAETKKIFNDQSIAVSATCVRVPVLRAHSVSITFECAQPISAADVRKMMETAPGVKLVDDWANNYFPMPKDASGQDEILVGRIRQDLSDPSGKSVTLFTAGDQLLKGAALNAVQIAERLVKVPALA
jgi:aspartate-semialdehyde dehydrogenase